MRLDPPLPLRLARLNVLQSRFLLGVNGVCDILGLSLPAEPIQYTGGRCACCACCACPAAALLVLLCCASFHQFQPHHDDGDGGALTSQARLHGIILHFPSVLSSLCLPRLSAFLHVTSISSQSLLLSLRRLFSVLLRRVRVLISSDILVKD